MTMGGLRLGPGGFQLGHTPAQFGFEPGHEYWHGTGHEPGHGHGSKPAQSPDLGDIGMCSGVTTGGLREGESFTGPHDSGGPQRHVDN